HAPHARGLQLIDDATGETLADAPTAHHLAMEREVGKEGGALREIVPHHREGPSGPSIVPRDSRGRDLPGQELIDEPNVPLLVVRQLMHLNSSRPYVCLGY